MTDKWCPGYAVRFFFFFFFVRWNISASLHTNGNDSGEREKHDASGEIGDKGIIIGTNFK